MSEVVCSPGIDVLTVGKQVIKYDNNCSIPQFVELRSYP